VHFARDSCPDSGSDVRECSLEADDKSDRSVAGFQSRHDRTWNVHLKLGRGRSNGAALSQAGALAIRGRNKDNERRRINRATEI